MNSKPVSEQLTPTEIVKQLDRHVIGQMAAKRAVAIALRNRWRRQQVESPMREEITPKNILMIGPTGVGKTEIARRLATLANAPLIKVEATKYTEVGYVGRDVESIIRDLLDSAIVMVEEEQRKQVQQKARKAAEEKLLDILIPHPVNSTPTTAHTSLSQKESREKMRRLLQLGELGDRQVEIDIQEQANLPILQMIPGQNPNDMDAGLKDMFSNLMGSGQKKRKRMSVREALNVLEQQEAEQLLDQDKVKQEAIQRTENAGIVFIDEVDKITHRDGKDGNVSREGVQRDLLPLVEGTSVSTRHGIVHTDHILFIASGAFHLSRPSDLIPELQGRFPIRVNLNALSEEDFRRILVEPESSLTHQYTALMKTEDVSLSFTKDGIEAIAEIAVQVNERTENIGARRLHTLLEHVLDEVSFNACECAGAHIEVNAAYVRQQLGDIAESEDLSRYIL